MRLRPLHDWLLVKLDPEPEHKVGSIHVIGSAIPRVLTATVTRVGPGRTNKSTGARIPHFVEEGARVAFFRENLEHQQGKQLAAKLAELEDGYALIRANDVLGVVDDDVLKDVFVQGDYAPYPPAKEARRDPHAGELYPNGSPSSLPKEFPLIRETMAGADRPKKVP